MHVGFFGSLFGKDQRRAINASTQAADRVLRESEGTARAQFNEGFDQQAAALQTGYNSGRGELAAGYDQARTDVNQGIDAQLAALQGGYNTARGDVGTGYDAARGDLTGQYGAAETALTDARSYVEQALAPFVQSGQRAQGLYDTALGLDGQPAAKNFYETYAANDPFREFNEDMTNKSLARSFNASGNLSSGRASLAASRANLERGSNDLNKYLDRLSAQGSQGGQYASRVADAGLQTGSQIANLRQGLGNQLGNLETNRGTALGNLATGYGESTGAAAANRGGALADLSRGRGTALSAYDYGYGVDRGNIAMNRGGANSDLTYGLAQQRANMQIGRGNSIANMQTQSANNLLSLGGAAISAWGNRPR